MTLLNDERTTFTFAGNQTYSPRDFEGKYFGPVTAQFALQWSLNNATIALAQMVGFDNVASLARDAGIKSARGTPAMAIGAYDASPLEMAGAYTVFANNGVKIDPWALSSVRSPNGDPIVDYSPVTKPILDPRAAFLTTALMENVINAGTGSVVRRMGFTAPAAGKTGTSDDSWFAGFTSNLICVVWVGNDDNSDIKIEGAHAAAPIWADFMKKAVALPQYSDTKDFPPPAGVVQVKLDKVTNLLADASCPDDNYTAFFLDGTQPTDTCDHSNSDQRKVLQQILGSGQQPAPPVLVPATTPQISAASPAQQPGGAGPGPQNLPVQPSPAPRKKRGFFSRLFGGDKKDKQEQSQPEPNP